MKRDAAFERLLLAHLYKEADEAGHVGRQAQARSAPAAYRRLGVARRVEGQGAVRLW